MLAISVLASKINLMLGEITLSELRRSVLGWFLQPFTDKFGVLIFPIFWSGVLVMLFGSSRNMTAVLAGILTTFAVYGSTAIIINNQAFSLFMSILASLLITVLILRIISKSTQGGYLE